MSKSHRNGIQKTLLQRIVGYFKLKNRKLRNKNVRPSLQLHLVDHCNLNCKGCAHYSPIANKSFIALEELEDAYSYLQSTAEMLFSRIELMGGEPLLHPQIEDAITMTRIFFPNIEIRLVTNGILLLSMPESFFECCAANKTRIYISMYPLALDYNKVISQLTMHRIDYGLYGDYEESRSFIAYRLDPAGRNNAVKSYRHCRLGGRCLQLKGNRIYPCFLSAYANHLNKYFGTTFKWQHEDYLDTSRGFTAEEFLRFINSPVPFCRYCPVERESVFDWSISNKEEAEWLIREG